MKTDLYDGGMRRSDALTLNLMYRLREELGRHFPHVDIELSTETVLGKGIFLCCTVNGRELEPVRVVAASSIDSPLWIAGMSDAAGQVFKQIAALYPTSDEEDPFCGAYDHVRGRSDA